MKQRLLRYLALGAAALAVAMFGALGGWELRGHIRSVPTDEVRSFSALEKGDASAAVRAGVLESLRGFQEGYLRRDPAQLDVFMRKMFPESDPVIVLGTTSNEWVGGYFSVSRFIHTDWLHWGDVRLDVENALVSSRGDVAWVATVGRVIMKNQSRPIRFAAVLMRYEKGWMFRQMQFQSVERGASLSQLLSPTALLRLFKKEVPTNMASVLEK